MDLPWVHLKNLRAVTICVLLHCAAFMPEERNSSHSIIRSPVIEEPCSLKSLEPC